MPGPAPRQIVTSKDQDVDSLSVRILAAVVSSAGKKGSIASSDSVMSTGVPNTMRVIGAFA
jgi:hypothetical protein